jgi:hypothetical protein
MEKVVQRFRSAEEADKADREYYRNLTPQLRLDMMPDIIYNHHTGGRPDATLPVLSRVCRVVKRAKS